MRFEAKKKGFKFICKPLARYVPIVSDIWCTKSKVIQCKGNSANKPMLCYLLGDKYKNVTLVFLWTLIELHILDTFIESDRTAGPGYLHSFMDNLQKCCVKFCDTWKVKNVDVVLLKMIHKSALNGLLLILVSLLCIV